jgi:hypothetical protein
MKNYDMTSPIEDSVIAYFDGRLNDGEGAELLHRVSVSPEIRQIFQEHEAMRQMANRAIRSVAVPPAVEEALFQRIGGIERERLLPPVFWSVRRISALAGVAALLIAGVVGTLELRDGGLGMLTGNSSPVAAANSPLGYTANIVPEMPPFQAAAVTKARQISNVTHTTHVTNVTHGSFSDAQPTNLSMPDDQPIALLPASRSSEVARITWPSSEPRTLESLRDITVLDQPYRFEVGISTQWSSFSVPAVVPTEPLFSDFSIRVGYNLDWNDQLGITLTRGTMPGLALISAPGAGFTDVNGQFKMQERYAGELFYQRREAVDHGLFFVSGGVGGGFYSLGTLVSAEAGIEAPFGDRLMGGVSLVVSRMHQNQPQQNLNEPVIYDGYNIYNSVSGRIEYSMAYRF